MGVSGGGRAWPKASTRRAGASLSSVKTLWAGANRSLTAVSFISSIVTILAFMIPSSRDWLSEHGLFGWVCFALAVVACCVFAGVGESRLGEARELMSSVGRELEDERKRADSLALRFEAQKSVADRGQIDKDLALIDDRLDGVAFGSSFHTLLMEGVDFKHVPVWYYRALKQATHQWKFDGRPLGNTQLAEAWSAVVATCRNYVNVAGSYLFVVDTDDYPFSDPDWLAVPVEWASLQKSDAISEMQAAHEQFAAAMSALDNLMQQLR